MIDFFLQCRDRLTYAIKTLPPDLVAEGGIAWSYQQQGGLAQISAELGVQFEDTGVVAGDYLEVVRRGEFDTLGFPLPRARGIVTIPESVLDLKETKKLTAVGFMADMDKVVLEGTFLDPVGSNQDLSWYAAQLVSEYQQRKAAILTGGGVVPPISTDIGNPLIGVNLEQLVCDPSTVREAFDKLYDAAAGSATWGWGINPLDGSNLIFFRVRREGVSRIFYVGSTVTMLSVPAELDQMVNGVLLKGGNAKFPNLVTNASYEQPMNPGSDSGGLLDNGGFEEPSNSTSYGGDTTIGSWTTSGGGVTRNAYDPGSNHNGSPHSGLWYLLLDTNGDYVYQDVDVHDTGAYPVGTNFIGYLYARNENDIHLAAGTVEATELDSGHSPVGGGNDVTTDVAPQSVAWTGGAVNSVVGSDSLQFSIQKSSASTYYIRIKVKVTSTFGAGFGLMIDDVVFAKEGEVGQVGWGTHLRNPGSGANSFGPIDWACRAAAWDGWYGVRAVVTAASNGNEVYFNPAGPDLNPNSQYHFQPAPQQDLLFGYRVRMKPGSGDGAARVEWREWASDGHQDSVQQTDNFTIPDDGTWYVLCGRFNTHGDVKTASFQLAIVAPGQYDVDGTFVQDAASSASQILIGLSGWSTSGADDHIQQLISNDVSQQSPVSADYTRSDTFERYVRAEDVCPGVGGTAADSSANASASSYGRREAVYRNENIIDWTADAQAILQAFFRKAANLLRRPRLTLVDEVDQVPLPSDAGQIQIAGVAAAASPDPQWCSAASYEWRSGLLTTRLDLSDERPTIAKLLKGWAYAAAASVSGGSVGGVAAGNGGSSGGGGTTTPPPAPVRQVDVFSPSGSTAAFTLSQAPSGPVTAYQQPDGLKIPQSAVSSVSGNVVTFTANPDAGTDTLEIEYWYVPVVV